MAREVHFREFTHVDNRAQAVDSRPLPDLTRHSGGVETVWRIGFFVRLDRIIGYFIRY